jgi:hypothetical protein
MILATPELPGGEKSSDVTSSPEVKKKMMGNEHLA